MKAVRPLAVMALAWVLVVAAVGTVTYLVVDRAGRALGQASDTSTLVAAPPSTSSRTAAPTSTGSSPSPSPGRSSTPRSTLGPTAAPAPTVPTGSTGSATTVRPSSTPTPTPTPTRTVSTRTASFTTRGGTVVASCTGDRIRLDSITPRDGWGFEPEIDGSQLEVKFTSRQDEVELHIRCVGGVPTGVDGTSSGADGTASSADGTLGVLDD